MRYHAQSTTTTFVRAVIVVACAGHALFAAGPRAAETKLPAVGTYSGHLTFTPDGTGVVYYDGRAIVTWDIARRLPIGAIPTKEWWFVLSPDGTRIASGMGRAIRLYDAKSGKLLHELKPPQTNAQPPQGDDVPFFRPLGFGERAKQLFTHNPDDVQVWDVATGKMVGRIVRQDDRLPLNNPGRQSHDGRWLGIEYVERVMEVLDTRTGQFTSITAKSLFDAVPPDGQKLMFLGLGAWSFAGDGETIYAADQANGLLAGWSLPDGKLRSYVKIPGLVFATVSRDTSRMLATYRKPDEKLLRVLDSQTLNVIATLGPLNDLVGSYAISPDNRYVAGSSSGDVRIWDLSPGTDAEPATTRPGPRTRRK